MKKRIKNIRSTKNTPGGRKAKEKKLTRKAKGPVLAPLSKRAAMVGARNR